MQVAIQAEYGKIYDRVMYCTFSDGTKVILQRDGLQGNMWHRAHMTIVSDVEFTVTLEGQIAGDRSDIAVDDISFTDGHCGKF